MKKAVEKNNFSKTQFLTLLYVIFTVFGFLMLFYPQISMIRISYCLSIFAIIIGIIFLTRYLITGSFQNIDQYGFSVGVLFIVLGICALFRAQDISNYFITIIGIILIISASIKLQYAVDLKVLQDKIWSFFLVVSVLIGLCAMLVLIFPFSENKNQSFFTYTVLTSDGIISLLSMIYLSIRIKRYSKKTIDMPDEATTSDRTKASNDKEDFSEGSKNADSEKNVDSSNKSDIDSNKKE